jgi:hypothetical protein
MSPVDFPDDFEMFKSAIARLVPKLHSNHSRCLSMVVAQQTSHPFTLVAISPTTSPGSGAAAPQASSPPERRERRSSAPP